MTAQPIGGLSPSETVRRWHVQIAENARLMAENVRLRAALEGIKGRIDIRMDNHLCGMKPDYDDSIVGFNEAWTIVRDTFAEAIAGD